MRFFILSLLLKINQKRKMMKKLYISLLLGLLVAVPKVALAQGSTTGNVYVGYTNYDDQIWEYDGFSLNHDSKVGCAIVLTKEMLAPYVGGTIKSMRVGWDTYSQSGNYEGFVRNTFNGENLSTGKKTVSFGWNSMTMSDYEIPEDVEQLVVGFTTTLKKDVCAIPKLYPNNVPNSCFLWVDGDVDDDGNPVWADMKAQGSLPILLVIKDTKGSFNFVPVVTMFAQNGIGISGEAGDCALRLKNAGSQAIRSLEITSKQGEQVDAKKVTLSKAIATGKTSETLLAPLTCFKSGDVEFSITKVNDKELAQPITRTANMLAIPKAVSEKFTRRPLVEYFESENNYRSPRYYDEFVGPMTESIRDEITFVSQHLDDQFMTGEDDATVLALQLCDNDSSRVSIPAMTIDRAMNTSNILVQMNTSRNPMFDVLADLYYFERLMTSVFNVPTFVSVEARGEIGEGELELNLSTEVTGEIAEGVLPDGEKPRLTVYLMERDVHSDSQLFWTEKEKEESMGEYVHANVIREVLADGEELPESGTYSWKMDSYEPDPLWNQENLYIVAFVHRDGKLGGKYMHVFNSTEGDISLFSGITLLDDEKQKNAEVYDLSGRKMTRQNTLSKGIYIVNGKKIVVK